MNHEHWGLNRPAFSLAGDPGSYYYQSPTHEEAQARLDFLVHQQRRLGILVGPHGVGKSMSLAFFAQRLRRQLASCVSLSVLGMDVAEFLWRLAVRLGAPPREMNQPVAAWQAIQDRIAVNQFQRLPTVVLVDDVEHAEHDVLLSIHRLVQSEAAPQAPLTVVLSVSEGRTPLLGQRLAELAELKIELEPWDLWQTTSFLQWSLQQAGRSEPTFTTLGVRRLFELTGGLPRRVVHLAELAMLAGAAEQLERIDEGVVEAAAEQLLLAGSVPATNLSE